MVLRGFFITIFCVMSLCCFSTAFGMDISSDTSHLTQQENSVAEIDAKIQRLEKRKTELNQLAKMYDREADRLLFVDYFGARWKTERAQQVRTKMKEIDIEITRLKNKREEVRRLGQ